MGDNLATSLSSWQVTALREEPDTATGQGGAEGWSRQRPWPQRRTSGEGRVQGPVVLQDDLKTNRITMICFFQYYTPTLQPLLNWLFEGIVLQVEVTNKYLPSQGLGEGSESTMQCMFESSSQKNAWREQLKTGHTRTGPGKLIKNRATETSQHSICIPSLVIVTSH